jgi:hypothetical protein
MAYGVIQFLEKGARKVTLVREDSGQPTGADGLMDPLSSFVEEVSPTMLREGSPGAVRLAMLFFAREQAAGRPLKILGADDEHGITSDEVRGLPSPGYYYEVHFGAPGERSPPQILAHGLAERGAGG